MWESQLLKEDSDLLQKVNPKQKKKLKKLVQTSEPSEYMGQDFTKLSDLVKELKSLDMMKSDKKMLKKILNKMLKKMLKNLKLKTFFKALIHYY